MTFEIFNPNPEWRDKVNSEIDKETLRNPQAAKSLILQRLDEFQRVFAPAMVETSGGVLEDSLGMKLADIKQEDRPLHSYDAGLIAREKKVDAIIEADDPKNRLDYIDVLLIMYYDGNGGLGSKFMRGLIQGFCRHWKLNDITKGVRQDAIKKKWSLIKKDSRINEDLYKRIEKITPFFNKKNYEGYEKMESDKIRSWEKYLRNKNK